MTKEFLFRKQESREAADAIVRSAVLAYLLEQNNPEWKWIHEPEVLFGKGGWRSYARIEWTKA